MKNSLLKQITCAIPVFLWTAIVLGQAPDSQSGGKTISTQASSKSPLASESPTVKGLVETFKTSREQALKEHDKLRKDLNEKLRSASGEERVRLIKEFQEKKQDWLDQHKSLAEEFRQRAKSMRDEFKNRERDQLLDEVKGKLQEVRERIGKD